MIWSEGVIARAISLQTLARKCVVLVDNCNWTGHECDVLGVTTDLRIIDVEVKISRSDLKADAKKDKWWHRVFAGYAPESREYFPDGRWKATYRESLWDSTPMMHPSKVWKHYYAMPADIWKPELLDFLPSPASGVILMREQRNSGTPVVAEVVRRATPSKDAYRLQPSQVLDIARLANLRMWEAYSREESANKQVSDMRNEHIQALAALQVQEAA